MTTPTPRSLDSARDRESEAERFWRRLQVVALWSVVLGIALEFVLVALTAILKDLPGPARLLTQFTSKVTWSFVVCLGISCGLSATRARGPVMGLLGLASGPVAFAIARSVHKGLGQALSIDLAADPTSPWVLAGLKAVEYGVLGLWVGRLSLASQPKLGRFLLAGATVGAVCGAIGVFLLLRAKPDADVVLLGSRCVNETVFPIGCAFVVFMANKTVAVARA